MLHSGAGSVMVRIQLTRYRKRYLTKAVYNCKRYFFYIPVRLGERLDLSIDYQVELRPPYIVLIPKNMATIGDAQEKLEGHEDE